MRHGWANYTLLQIDQIPNTLEILLGIFLQRSFGYNLNHEQDPWIYRAIPVKLQQPV